jgi:hypothetical protein
MRSCGPCLIVYLAASRPSAVRCGGARSGDELVSVRACPACSPSTPPVPRARVSRRGPLWRGVCADALPDAAAGAQSQEGHKRYIALRNLRAE